MCLAVPAKIVKLLPDSQAEVVIGEMQQTVSVALIDKPAIGDFVILHVGYALEKLDPEEAEKTLQLLKSIEA